MSSATGCFRPNSPVYHVLAMTLFSSAGYEEVMRCLTERVSLGAGRCRGLRVALRVTAISKARTRLGAEPLAELFARARVPLATPATRQGVLPPVAAGEHRRHNDRHRPHTSELCGVRSGNNRAR